MTIRVRRAYDPPAAEDGCRVLVDRLWPRGLARENARIEHWLRELAPSHELRKWFAHDPARWDEFQLRYRKEIAQHPVLLDQLRDLARKGVITLVYSAHDEVHNDAVVLQHVLLGHAAAHAA